MMKFKRAIKYCVSPLDMKPERLGAFGIEVEDFPPGYKETAVSLRTAFMSGEPVQQILHKNGVRRHYLREYEGDRQGLLMSDKAQEMIDFAEPIHRMSRMLSPSDVLIGGLGLGFVAHWAARLGHRVTVIEIEPDIIKLCGKYLPEGVKVVQADLLKYIADADVRKFRFAIFDTWYGQNEATFWSDVVPLRRAWNREGGDPKRVWCWKEQDEMWAQVYRSTLLTDQMLNHPEEFPPSPYPNQEPPKVEHLWAPFRIFFDGLRREALLGSQTADYAALYVRGLADSRKAAARWEAMWGADWDKEVAKAEEWARDHHQKAEVNDENRSS